MRDVNCYGDYVEVVRGRKVPKGTRGTIVWIGVYERGYRGSGIDPYKCEQRIGIKDDNGNMHYTYTKNVELVSTIERGDEVDNLKITPSNEYNVKVVDYIRYEGLYYGDSYMEAEDEAIGTFKSVKEAKEFIKENIMYLSCSGHYIEVEVNGKLYISREV